MERKDLKMKGKQYFGTTAVRNHILLWSFGNCTNLKLAFHCLIQL